jgi:hypothetical protein
MDASEITAIERFVFNGVEGRSGRYLFPPMSAAEIVRGLRKKRKSRERPIPPGTDPRDLAQLGWGVLFHHQEDDEIREALTPLLEHRKAQASRRYAHYYKELSGPQGYRDGLGKEDFLADHDADLGMVNPNRMPYYLLLVGGPERIPFHFQHQLDVQCAVGRIAFDTPDEYARYARSVVEAETSGLACERRMALFGVKNPDDHATKLTADLLIRPLEERLVTLEDWQQVRDWQVASVLEREATKERLGRLLGGAETPALLFTASHGVGFLEGDPLQRAHQGALLCQDWPGPEQWQESIPADFYFSGDDVSASAHLHGLIAFFFACHGAGVPAIDEFAVNADEPPRPLAPKPFVSHLPQKLLAHPNGGALAVIGHVERTWAHSFLSKRSQSQIQAFELTLRMLMEGYPVGYAMEWFNYRYGALAADLTLAIQKMGYGEQLDEDELAGLWIANNDARNYAVIGDPAVRVKVG